MTIVSILLASVLFAFPMGSCAGAPDGGPPSIRIAGKVSGDITAAQWATLKTVELASCVPGARIVSLTICIKDCKNNDALAGSESGVVTAYQHQMIRNLPPGTSFKVRAVVRDAKGRAWDVPDAIFKWRS